MNGFRSGERSVCHWSGSRDGFGDRRNGHRSRGEFAFETFYDGLDFGSVFRSGFDGQILAVFLQGQFVVVLILMRDDGEVQDRRRVLGILLQGGVEFALRFGVAIALQIDDAERVVDLRTGLQAAGGFEIFFGAVEFALFFGRGRLGCPAEVNGAEFGETFSILRAQGAICNKWVDGCGVVFLFEQEDAEVVVGFDEIAIEFQRLLVRFVGFFGLAGILVGEAEEVPGLRLDGRGIFGEEARGFFEFFDGSGVIAFAQEFFAFDNSAWTSRAAGAENDREGGNQEQRGQFWSPFFNGHHARAC